MEYAYDGTMLRLVNFSLDAIYFLIQQEQEKSKNTNIWDVRQVSLV